MPDREPTKREITSARRKDAILAAAVSCIIENGYHQTGVRDIAKKADVSLGNLYNYFSGKADVLAEIARIERAELEPFLNILEKDAPALELLEEFVPAYTRYLAKPETIILALEITLEAIREIEIADLFTESRNTLIAAIAAVLECGATEGCMRQMRSYSETAHLVLEIMEGTAFRHGIEDVELRALVENELEFIRAAIAA
jgi:AcrR family transcriptional regulator